MGHKKLSAQVHVSKQDSILFAKVDSLKLPRFDTLFNTHALDTRSFAVLDQIDSTIQRTNQKIDSLQALKLPTQKYVRKLDSLQARLQQQVRFNKSDSVTRKISGTLASADHTRDSVQQSISKRIEALQQKINQKLSFRDSLTMGSNPLGLQADNPLKDLKLTLPNGPSAAGTKSTTLNTPSTDLSLPKTELPKTSMPNEINKLNTQVNDLQQMPKQKMGEWELTKEIDRIEGQLAKVGEVTAKAEQYKDEIKEIRAGNIEKVEALPKELENAALQVGEVKEFSAGQQKFASTKNMLEQYKDMVANVQDSDELKDKAKETAAKEMPDYFSGQEDKLKAGVAQLDKLKRKYKTIPDSRYLPKHVPNEMKGKPFRERVVPGMSLQFYKSDLAALDFSPYLAYKLSGRFRPGVGASWRAAVSIKDPTFRYDEVFGVRVFNDLRWRGNFYLHTEGEWLHFSQAALLRYKFPADEDRQAWQFRLNAGLFRTYRISQRINGQAQFLYNVLDLKHFPQAKNTSIRIGFEYVIKKKTK